MFPLHPFLGVGSGAYGYSVIPIIGRSEDGPFVAHNTYLSILVECGLVGLLIVILLVLVLARHVAALPGARAIMWTFCLLTLATGMTSATWENYKAAWVLLSLCCSAESAQKARKVHIVTSPPYQGSSRRRCHLATDSRAESKPQGWSDLSQVISTASVEHKPSMSLRANFSATFVGNAVFAEYQPVGGY